MSLPKIPAGFLAVDVAGETIDIRIITRGEAARFQRMVETDTPKDELEIAVIGAATDTPLAEVREWYAATPSYAVEELMGHIKRSSRLEEGAQKSGGTGDSPGGG